VAGYDVADVGDLDAEGPGGMVRKVRRAVGAKAFGCN
jgi:mannose-6-phosphate isomerase-like protein (cupin superfamily)